MPSTTLSKKLQDEPQANEVEPQDDGEYSEEEGEDEDGEEQEEDEPEKQAVPTPVDGEGRRKRQAPSKPRKQGNIADDGTLDDAEEQGMELVGNTASEATEQVGAAGKQLGKTAGGVTKGLTGGGQEKGKGGKKDDDGGDQLRLRLDLNLEIELTLKAKIHGDLTLGLL